jgi:hypothetical protein
LPGARSRDEENVWSYKVVMAAQPYEHTKDHWIVCLKWENYITCELYSKAVKKKNLVLGSTEV